MSVHDRLKLVNLRVESFLEANNASPLKDAWYEDDNQQKVLMLLDPFAPTTPPALTVVVGVHAVAVPRDIKRVTLGKHPVSEVRDGVLGVNVDGAADEHVVITKFGQHSYRVQTHAPTWVRVGKQFPVSLGIPTQLRRAQHDRTGVVLQPTSVFHVGSHVFHVANAPLLLKRHVNHLPVASSVTNAELVHATFDRVAEEIEQSDDAFCMLQCVAPTTSLLFNRVWRFGYGKGNVFWSVGTSDNCTVCVDGQCDSQVAPVHCRIHALMGYFWLLDGWSPVGTHVYQHPGAPPLTLKIGSSQSIALLVGDTEVSMLLG